MKNTKFELLNLDCPNEVEDFIAKYNTTKGAKLANMLGIKGKGRNKIANALSNYAWNKKTAMEQRKVGNISTAVSYGNICDRIYNDLPQEFKW